YLSNVKGWGADPKLSDRHDILERLPSGVASVWGISAPGCRMASVSVLGV
ncbi:hypothetical protein KIPB_010762, partial [Kipferlia bialata]